MVMEDVNRINRIEDPLERNGAFNQAYRDLADAMPQNRWVRLASYVSTQAGCAMSRFYASETWTGVAAQTLGRVIVNPTDAINMLEDANRTIFNSVFPPNKFMQQCGFEKLKECVENGELDVPSDLMEALERLDNGDVVGASNAIARHEQLSVVEPIYQEHRDTFEDMQSADGWVPGDQTSIPVSYECTRDNLVSLGDLDLGDANDRVTYYNRLMERMLEQERE